MDFMNPYATIEVSLIELIRNLAVGLIFAVIWSLVIGRTTRLVVDTRQYLPVFLLLIPTMILIISIIKSSIALSLGLVGALSIVRFRTPIKEPEELLYLFVAIAVGLGLGANQLVATFIGFISICLALIPFALHKNSSNEIINSYINLIFPGKSKDIDVSQIESALHDLDLKYRIKRIDSSDEGIEVLLDVVNYKISGFQSLKSRLLQINESVKIIVTENARVIT